MKDDWNDTLARVEDAFAFYEEHKHETVEMRIRLLLRLGKISEEDAERLRRENVELSVH